jgi:hypothetical protein
LLIKQNYAIIKTDMEGIKTSQANQEEMAIWSQLKEHPAWLRVVSYLQERVKEADIVVNQIGGDRELEFSKRDLAILKKNSYLDLIELPDTMSAQLSGTGIMPSPEADDPYEEVPEKQSEATDDL